MGDSQLLPRRLAAVLYADVAGYSRLTATDEDGTHRRLSSYLDLFATTVQEHGGKVMHYAGDAVLAEFDAAVAAVSCAVDLQREFADRNAELPQDQRIDFRIGVNIGDVIEDRGDVYGDGVNVAARLETLAIPGGICVAEAVRTALGTRLALVFEDLGERRLKNIDHPVHAYRVRVPAEPSMRHEPASWLRRLPRGRRGMLGLAAAAVLATGLIVIGVGVYRGHGQEDAVAGAGTPGPATQKTVAVLPFADLSEGGGQAWLADGLAEEILNSLAQTEMHVTARTSSFRFRDQDRDLREIASRLGVANVVEGSVRLNGDQLRVAAQLSRASDGFHLWSQVYEGTTADLFEFQRDVAERVAAALDVVLDEDLRERMFASGTRNVEAFRECQQGWQIYRLLHNAKSEQTLWDASRHFERALELDPGYAQAAIGRTDAFIHLLYQPSADFIRDAPYSQEEALALLLETLDLAAAGSRSETTRLAALINREFYSPLWSQMSSLLAQLRRQWDVDAFAFVGGVDSGIGLSEILFLAGHIDLARSLAEKHMADDPLSKDAWYRKLSVEIHARDFDAARAVLGEARRAIGYTYQLAYFERVIAQLEGDRAKVLEVFHIVSQCSPESTAPEGARKYGCMFKAAVTGDYATAREIAQEMEQQLEDPPFTGCAWWCLLYAYYEIGDAERSRALVKRIDDSPGGTVILARLLVDWGNARFFDVNDAPNFRRKLGWAGIDPASFQPVPRLSTLP